MSSKYAGYGRIEYYTNYVIFFYVVCAELLLPSVVGFRILVVMSCSRGHRSCHVSYLVSQRSLLCSFILLFFFFTSFRILWRGSRAPQGPIFPIPNSTRMRYSEFYQRFFPTYLLDLCISRDRLDLSSYSVTRISSSLCHSFYHFCQKMWNLYVETPLYTSRHSLPSGLQK